MPFSPITKTKRKPNNNLLLDEKYIKKCYDIFLNNKNVTQMSEASKGKLFLHLVLHTRFENMDYTK